jgi:hypothetical protein
MTKLSFTAAALLCAFPLLTGCFSTSDRVSGGTAGNAGVAGASGECAPGCEASFQGDGFCDSACDVPACGNDTGDCGGGTAGTGGAAGNGGIAACTCTVAWIGDGLCDTSCDNAACAYDGGDCGGGTAGTGGAAGTGGNPNDIIPDPTSPTDNTAAIASICNAMLSVGCPSDTLAECVQGGQDAQAPAYAAGCGAEYDQFISCAATAQASDFSCDVAGYAYASPTFCESDIYVYSACLTAM